MIFSIGFNGYDRLWHRCVTSHREYAQRNGYTYAMIGEGVATPLSMESAWLKIPLLIAALDAGHQWILFVDADAMFTEQAPKYETVENDSSDIYLANGYSGRPNSGVIIVKNTKEVRALLLRILFTAGMPLPRRDRVGWGENGEVIHHVRSYPKRASLDQRWNNNFDLDLDDYIRHYSFGEMRDTYDYGDNANETGLIIKSTEANVHNRPGSLVFFDGLIGLLEHADKAVFKTKQVAAEIEAERDRISKIPFGMHRIAWRIRNGVFL